MEVEDQIQFAHIPKILIKHFHKCLDEFQDNELVFVFVDDGDKVETGISFVDDFVVLVLDKVAHFGFTSDD